MTTIQNNHSRSGLEEELLPQQKDEQRVSRRVAFVKKYYAYISIFAGISFGTQLFFYEAIVYKVIGKGNVEFSLFTPQFVGFFIAGFLYHIKEAIHSKMTTGVFWKIENSSYFIVEGASKTNANESPRGIQDNQTITPVVMPRTRLNLFNIWAVALRTFVQVTYVVLKIMVMKTAAAAGLNFSLVANIYSITPFWVAIAFYFLFKEKITKIHLLGISLITVCIVLTGISSSGHSAPKDGELHPFVPLMIAVVYTLVLTLVSWTTRYVVNNSSMTVQQLMADSYIANGIIFLALLLILGFPYPKIVIFQVGCISILYTIGQYTLNEAVGHGKAASAQALHEIQSLWALILEIVFLSKIPNALQIVAFGIGFVGGVILALEARRDSH